MPISVQVGIAGPAPLPGGYHPPGEKRLRRLCHLLPYVIGAAAPATGSVSLHLYIRIPGVDMSYSRSSAIWMTPPEPTQVGVPVRSVGLPAPRHLCERFGLTPREAQVARRLAVRRTNAEIAGELHLSEHTVRRHTERILRKMSINSRRDVYGVICAAFEAEERGEPVEVGMN